MIRAMNAERLKAKQAPLKDAYTAFGLDIRGGKAVVEGDLDLRGTLGVAKDAPVGFSAIRLRFDIDSDAAQRAGHQRVPGEAGLDFR
jgi:hypothetical protein